MVSTARSKKAISGIDDGVAKIYVHDDGSVVINSFAHGGAKYNVRDVDPNLFVV